jgi:transposase
MHIAPRTGGVAMSCANRASRRRFLKLATGALALATTGVLPRSAYAAELPLLGENEPTAKALGYVENAAASTNPKHRPGAACANCQFYRGGAGDRGACQVFPGKSVNARGWCVSHVPASA